MDEKKIIEMQLIKNPAYSSGWIDNASHLIANCGLTEDELKKFDTEQLQLLVSMFSSAEKNPEIDINRFLNPYLNQSQMQVLLTGYSHGLKTEALAKYFNPEIPYVVSNWAITALVEGFDLSSYVDAGYDPDQLYEIYCGMKQGIDYSIYDCIEIPAEKMSVCRHALSLGLKAKINDNKELTIE
jgi:hypothetical protein